MKKALPFLAALLLMLLGLYFYSLRNAGQDRVIKEETLKAAAMLQQIYEQSQKQGLGLEQAKKLGADRLRGIRYGSDKSGYFWADTVDGLNIVHLDRRNMEGKMRIDYNINGIYYIRELIKQGLKSGGGYTDYYFPKPGQMAPSKKRAFTILFKPFNWIIGTGYYL